MIPMAQAQAGGSTRMSDVHIITTNISRRAADRAANEGAAQPDFNSAAPPASLAAGGHSGPCRTSRKPRHVSSRFGCRRDAAICSAAAGRPALRVGDFEWHMVEKNIMMTVDLATDPVAPMHPLPPLARWRPVAATESQAARTCVVFNVYDPITHKTLSLIHI